MAGCRSQCKLVVARMSHTNLFPPRTSHRRSDYRHAMNLGVNSVANPAGQRVGRTDAVAD